MLLAKFYRSLKTTHRTSSILRLRRSILCLLFGPTVNRRSILTDIWNSRSTELVTDYRQVCAENGITPVVSSTLTSQFNGLVESRHNQIRQMASAMLYNAVLGHEFWGLAWEHASSFGFASCGSERNGHTKEVNRCCREPSRTQVYLLLLTSLLKRLPGQQELVRTTFEMRSSTSFT